MCREQNGGYLGAPQAGSRHDTVCSHTSRDTINTRQLTRGGLVCSTFDLFIYLHSPRFPLPVSAPGFRSPFPLPVSARLSPPTDKTRAGTAVPAVRTLVCTTNDSRISHFLFTAKWPQPSLFHRCPRRQPRSFWQASTCRPAQRQTHYFSIHYSSTYIHEADGTHTHTLHEADENMRIFKKKKRFDSMKSYLYRLCGARSPSPLLALTRLKNSEKKKRVVCIVLYACMYVQQQPHFLATYPLPATDSDSHSQGLSPLFDERRHAVQQDRHDRLVEVRANRERLYVEAVLQRLRGFLLRGLYLRYGYRGGPLLRDEACL